MKTGKTPARKAVREKELITAYPKLFVTDINRAANYYEQKLRPPVFHRAFASLRDGFLGWFALPTSAIQPSLLGLFCPLYSCPFASVRGSRESTAGLAETLQATGRQSEHLMKTAG